MSDVMLSIDGHVARVRLNRPQALNAITPEMDDLLADAWQTINSDPDVWVAVLSAEGERAFCAGADVKGEHAPRRVALGGGITGVGGPLLQVEKPLIVAVQGYVLGGGFEIAMCGDIVVAADTTQFGIPEIKAGIIGEAGIMHRAIRQLPHRVALAMILTGERLPAERAYALGLVNEVVPSASLQEATQRWTEKLLAVSPLAARAAKQAVLSRASEPLEVALSTRYEPIEEYAFSADVEEGRRAFAERRAPSWSGS